MRALLLVTSVCLLNAGILLGQQQAPTGSNEITQLRQTVEQLKKENANLKDENQMLRKLLAGTASSTPTTTDTPATNQVPTAELEKPVPPPDGTTTTNQASRAKSEKTVTTTDNKETGYWLTTLTNRRHNRNCKYYNVSRGRFWSKDEGIPCKYCGG